VPLYWRLSSFYFFYFGTLGAMMPYWGLYLQSLGFEAQAIGELIAIIMATKMIAPNIWGWLADRSQCHIRLVRISSFLASICFTGIFWGHSYYWLAFIMILFSFFWNAALPQFEATTLAHLGQHARRYSHIRLWGSIGFILTVGLFGHLFEHIDIQFLPWFILGLLSSIGLSSLLVPEAHKASASGIPVAFHQILRQPAVIALFSVFLLMQASHGPYYAFYSIYLEEYDYSRQLIGQLWALGVIAEVGVFLLMHHLLERYNLKKLLIISLALTGLRWLLIGYYVNNLTILTLAQLFHAASFGMYHGVAMQFIRNYFTDHHLGRAQALYSSLSFGAGGALGSWISGYTWATLGAMMTYSLATLLCLLAILISWRWLATHPLNTHS